MFSSATTAIIVFTFMGIVTFGLALLIPAVFEKLPNVILLKRKLILLVEEERKIAARLEQLKSDRQAVEDNITKIESEQRVLQDRLKMFPPNKELPVVELGQPLQNNKLFEAFIHNNSVRRSRRTESIPAVNPFWEEPRYVVVWAQDLSEARNEINTTYPASKDWHVEFRGEVTF
jgi:hypothetical protein